MSDNRTEFIILGGIGSAIIISLFLIPSFQADTIFLVNGNDDTPTPCAGNTGLVLAQNLTDLCDVTIINPVTNELLSYNGSQWINVDSMVFNDTITCTNLGTGTIICPSFSEDNINIRTLLEGSGIDISNSSTEITITNTLPESTECIPLQTSMLNITVVHSSVNGDCYIRSLRGGTGISIINNNQTVIITNTLPESTVCDNQTTGFGLCVNDDITLKNLLAGSGISMSSNATHITITNTGVLSVTSNNNATIGVVPTTGNVVLYPKYELLCQTTLASANSTITCDISARKHLIIELHGRPNGGTGVQPALRFNNDNGTNYSFRVSSNGGADTTVTSTTRCNLVADTALFPSGNIFDNTLTMSNLSGDRKLGYGERVNGGDTSSATAPNRSENVCKWDNTSVQITRITVIAFTGTGNYNTNSQLTVWGYD